MDCCSHGFRVALGIDTPDELLLLLLIRINVRIEALNELIKGRVGTKSASRRHLDPALGTLFLPEPQILFDALLAKAVEAFHEGVCRAHDREADGARELGVEEARRNAAPIVAFRQNRPRWLVDTPHADLAAFACACCTELDELAVTVPVPILPLPIIVLSLPIIVSILSLPVISVLLFFFLLDLLVLVLVCVLGLDVF